MNGLHQRNTDFSKFVDRVQFQDGVVYHNTTSHNDTDGRHQVQRMSKNPQGHQCKRNVNRNFDQDDKRLQEAFKLGTQDKVHQQDADKQDDCQFAHHLFVREEASGKIHFPTVGLIHLLLHLSNQFRYFYRKTRKLQNYYISRDGLSHYQRNNRPLIGDGVQEFAPAIGTGMLDATICDIYLVDDAGATCFDILISSSI